MDILALMLLLVILYGLCHGLVFWGRVPSAIGPAAVVGLIIGTLFLADFADFLRPTSLAFAAIGFGAACHGLFEFLRKRKEMRSPLILRVTSLMWGVVLLLFFLLYAANRQKMFYQWDEFSHWGTVIRMVFIANTFHFDPNPLYFQDYPPGMALFAFFILTILGYSEGGAYFAYALVLLAHCIPLWRLAYPKGVIPLAIAISVSIVLIALLGQGWSTVLIDQILSVCFAGLIASYFLIRKDSSTRWSLSLLFITLILTKHAGASLAFLACILIFFDSFTISIYESFQRSQGLKPISFLIHAVAYAGIWLLLLLPALAFSRLWMHYVESANLSRGYGRFGVWQLFQYGLDCCESKREHIILRRYLDQWLGLPDVLVGYSPLLLTIALITISLLAIALAPSGLARLRQGIALIILVCANLLFATVQLLFYLYAFDEYEALAIASFRRFQNTYYLAWALSAFSLLFLSLPDSSSLNMARWRKFFYCIVLAAIISLGFRIVSPGSISELSRQERMSLRAWVENLPLPADNHSKVYIVWQGSNGFEFWKVYHEVLPRMTNSHCYSLGPPHFANDIWSCPYDDARFRTELRGYDYLLVAGGYSDLRINYPNFLPDLGLNTDRQLLRIEYFDGVLRLRPMP
jgi:hypothetical protein